MKSIKQNLAEKASGNKRNRKHALSPERENEAVETYLRPGETLRSVGKKFGVSHGTIFRLVCKRMHS